MRLLFMHFVDHGWETDYQKKVRFELTLIDTAFCMYFQVCCFWWYIINISCTYCNRDATKMVAYWVVYENGCVECIWSPMVCSPFAAVAFKSLDRMMFYSDKRKHLWFTELVGSAFTFTWFWLLESLLSWWPS